MTPERWRKITDLFHAALAREAGLREAFVHEACAEDPALRSEVEDLLAAHQEGSWASRAAESILSEPPLPLTGRTLGHYHILGRIGAGGMGEVYRAHDAVLDREVAIKILAAHLADEAAAKARFLREARAAAALNHPHVCIVHEVGEADGQIFIAMELIEGRPLDRVIPAGGLDAAAILRYGLEITDAVAHAHDRGVVHRDLKPANVLISPQDRAKVVDFGLATRASTLGATDASTRSADALTQPGMLIGTLPYMAPEQFRGRSADARSDVWALGVVLYEMIAGARPFEGHNRFELSSAILTAPPAPLPASAPPALRAIVDRCLLKEPDRRYPRAAEVHSALRALQGGGIAIRTGPSRRLSSRRAFLAGTIVLLAGLVALVPGRVRQRLTGEAPPSIVRLAVLPFQNLTGDPEQEYFSDGLTDDMITELGRLHPGRLSVIARTSIMRYKRTDKSLRTIGGELGVDYILESSVRREAGRVRVNAALVRVGDETRQWTESYEREATTILALQSDVARGVAGSLALALLPGERTRLGRAQPVDPEAYDAYLKGRQYAAKLTSADLDTALRHFERALEKDPDYALAYTGLATVWSGRQQMGFYPAREATPRAKDAIFKALALDDSLSEAHLRLAGSKAWSDWDWAGAEPEFQKAITLNPSYPDARAFYSHFLHIMKRPAEAMQQMDRALELDPFNPLFQALGGVDLILVRRYDEAIGRFQNALKMAPGNPIAMTGLGNALHLKGLFKEALAVEREAATKSGDRQRLQALDVGEAEGGYGGAMRRVADLLAARFGARGMAPAHVAVLYLRAQDEERAFEWLERSFAARDPNLPYLRVWPFSDGLRRDPRFYDLLKRMGLSS